MPLTHMVCDFPIKCNILRKVYPTQLHSTTCVKARVKRASKMSFITDSYQYFLTLNKTIRLLELEPVRYLELWSWSYRGSHGLYKTPLNHLNDFRHQDMVSVDNLGRKLCSILQSKSFRGNDVEYEYNVTGYQNRGSVKKRQIMM
jgi:hypothetical protein